MGVNASKIISAAKFLFNRAAGVKYGGVKFGDGTFKLVRTSKLSKLNDRIYDRLGTDCAQSLGKDGVNSIMRMTRPIYGKGSQAIGSGNIEYLNAHRYCQLYDKTANKPVLDICEELRNPIKTWWKMG